MGKGFDQVVGGEKQRHFFKNIVGHAAENNAVQVIMMNS
jgi:hypothetical protein